MTVHGMKFTKRIGKKENGRLSRERMLWTKRSFATHGDGEFDGAV